MAAMTTLLDRLRALVLQRDPSARKRALRAERPEDLAEAIVRLEPEEAASLLVDMDDLQAANVMVELPTETARALARHLPDTVLAAYLDVLPMDDAIDLQEELEPDRFEGLLEVIPEDDAREIRRLMKSPRGSVGRMMTERFFEVSPETTMEQLLADLRHASEDKYETVNDVYVLDEAGRLQGVFSLRKALRAEPGTRASEVMREDVVVAHLDDSDEDAARRMARYGFYALPVLDAEGRMVGLFTGDDAQSVLREAESKDVLALGAVSGSVESYLSLNVFQLYKRRMPWLLALFIAETLTGAVMRHYTGMAGDARGVGILALVPFIPLIIGAGGNSGSQVTTTITRALALGELGPRDWAHVLAREFLTASMIGVTLGIVGFLRALVGWQSPIELCWVVAMALPTVVVWAGLVGSLLPVAAKRAGFDPAVMSAPFITTFVDATGLVIYFEIALRVIGHS